MTGWEEEGRTSDVVYFDFSKTADTVSHNIFIGKLRKCGLDKRRVRHMPVKYSRGMESLACFSSQMDNNRVRANTVIA